MALDWLFGDRLSNGTQIRITFAESGEKLADFPRRRRCFARGGLDVEAQSKTRPAEMADAARLEFVNPLWKYSPYNTSLPAAHAAILRDALVYFAHRRHRRPPLLVSLLPSSAPYTLKDAWDTSTRLRTPRARIIRKATSPTSRDREREERRDGSFSHEIASRLWIAAKERLRSRSAIHHFQDLPLKMISIEY